MYLMYSFTVLLIAQRTEKETGCNSAFITTREIEKADEKVKQVLDASAVLAS